MKSFVLVSALCAAASAGASSSPALRGSNTTAVTRLGQTPAEIITKYQPVVNEIVSFVLNDYKGRAYDKLSVFCDTWGHRMQGSEIMEKAIDGHAAVLEQEGFVTQKTPCTTCPHWERGEESAEIMTPLIGGKTHKMAMTGLGRSVGTSAEGITAPVLVCKDFEALEAACAQAAGKIVVWNLGGWFGYGENNKYRTQGADAASKCGAVASLTRSVTPFSLSSPHTGSMEYDEGVTPIPTAAITSEDADLLTRMQVRAPAGATAARASGPGTD